MYILKLENGDIMDKNKKKTNNSKKSNNTIIKLKSDFNVNNMISNKKLKTSMIIVLIVLIALVLRIAWIQFIDGSRLKELSYSQQNINQIISPKRGNIYDSTGTPLAISAQVDTITINPKKIKGKTDDATKALQEKIAKAFCEIFELDYEETLSKVQSTSSVETIVKKVEQDKVDKLKAWMKENDTYAGINIDEDTKRYYPYSTLASAVLGFCGTDNDGRFGIENKWNSVLSGTPGKIVSSKDGSQSEIPNSEKTYIAAEDGSNLTLTLDINVQKIIEKYLKQAVEDNSCARGGNVIVMSPTNGDILGMASYPNYDLNNPSSPNSYLVTNWDSLSTEEKSASLYSMWSNKSIHETYEPGSTFKVITASVALEENITETDIEGEFICTGSHNVAGKNIKCWKYPESHGQQSLRKALMNSCNPAFMQLGKRISAPTLYKYYKAFGLFDKTGVALPGEANSIFHDLDNVGAVELATMSFGQRITITPLQMITAISAVANDGILMQPRIVKEITNTDTGAITTVDPVEIRQVISKQTSEEVKSMMESVATIGTGKTANISGYSIGGKTGTSEPNASDPDAGYVASYVAISPIENTEVVLLLTLYKPQGTSHQGGQVAGPVVKQMLSEILPYLGVASSESTSTSSNNSSNSVTLPNVTNKTVTEAKKILTSLGLKTSYSVSGNANSLLVTDQVPKAGTTLLPGSIVKLYSEENNIRTSVEVPDLKGMTSSQAVNSLKSKNLNISIEGTGVVSSQNPAKETTVEEGTVIQVTLNEDLNNAH